MSARVAIVLLVALFCWLAGGPFQIVALLLLVFALVLLIRGSNW